MTLGKGRDAPLSHEQQLCVILSRSNMAMRSYGPDTRLWVCVHCDLDLGYVTSSQCHHTPLSHGQQLCEISFSSKAKVRRYVPDTDFECVCTVTLTSDIWPLIMTHSGIIYQYLREILSRSNKAMRSYALIWILGICALWHWLWKYDLGSRSWHIIRSGRIIV